MIVSKQKAERQQVVDNNKAWRAAENVRRAFVRGLLARKTTPKGTLRFVAAFVVGDPEYLARGSEEMVADLLGSEASATDYRRHAGPDALADAADSRVPLVLLAQVAAAVEAQIGVHTWRHPDDRAARYLAWLQEVGYTLSDVEALVARPESGAKA